MVAIAVAIGTCACKVRMNDSLLRRDATGGIIDKQRVEQVEAYVVQSGNDGGNVGPVPLGEGRLEIRK